MDSSIIFNGRDDPNLTVELLYQGNTLSLVQHPESSPSHRQYHLSADSPLLDQPTDPEPKDIQIRISRPPLLSSDDLEIHPTLNGRECRPGRIRSRNLNTVIRLVEVEEEMEIEDDGDGGKLRQITIPPRREDGSLVLNTYNPSSRDPALAKDVMSFYNGELPAFEPSSTLFAGPCVESAEGTSTPWCRYTFHLSPPPIIQPVPSRRPAPPRSPRAFLYRQPGSRTVVLSPAQRTTMSPTGPAATQLMIQEPQCQSLFAPPGSTGEIQGGQTGLINEVTSHFGSQEVTGSSVLPTDNVSYDSPAEAAGTDTEWAAHPSPVPSDSHSTPPLIPDIIITSPTPPPASPPPAASASQPASSPQSATDQPDVTGSDSSNNFCGTPNPTLSSPDAPAAAQQSEMEYDEFCDPDAPDDLLAILEALPLPEVGHHAVEAAPNVIPPVDPQSAESVAAVMELARPDTALIDQHDNALVDSTTPTSDPAEVEDLLNDINLDTIEPYPSPAASPIKDPGSTPPSPTRRRIHQTRPAARFFQPLSQMPIPHLPSSCPPPAEYQPRQARLPEQSDTHRRRESDRVSGDESFRGGAARRATPGSRPGPPNTEGRESRRYMERVDRYQPSRETPPPKPVKSRHHSIDPKPTKRQPAAQASSPSPAPAPAPAKAPAPEPISAAPKPKRKRPAEIIPMWTSRAAFDPSEDELRRIRRASRKQREEKDRDKRDRELLHQAGSSGLGKKKKEKRYPHESGTERRKEKREERRGAKRSRETVFGSAMEDVIDMTLDSD